jgi:hypothetical protein
MTTSSDCVLQGNQATQAGYSLLNSDRNKHNYTQDREYMYVLYN